VAVSRSRSMVRAGVGRDGGARMRNRRGRVASERATREGARNGLAEIQRARMIAAMVDVAREHGVAQTTVAHIVAHSGVSRRTFYELFDDRDDCFLAAFEEAVERAALRVVPPFQSVGRWRERVGASLLAFLEFLEDEPGLGAFCVVDALGAGPAALACRARVVRALVDAVDQGRLEAKAGLQPTPLTAEGVVGALLGVLYARLAAVPSEVFNESPRTADDGGKSTMVELLGPLMAMIILPYQGHAAAARESARPAPVRHCAAPVHGDPLRGLEMRLTYRTVRVLLAVAAHPGASNRQVADASGVHDQGQISKLLARMEHLGLIRNGDAKPLRGEPNDWRLTSRGEEIERAIRSRAAPVEA
jgi:AcrR family transcriptional regulator